MDISLEHNAVVIFYIVNNGKVNAQVFRQTANIKRVTDIFKLSYIFFANTERIELFGNVTRIPIGGDKRKEEGSFFSVSADKGGFMKVFLAYALYQCAFFFVGETESVNRIKENTYVRNIKHPFV